MMCPDCKELLEALKLAIKWMPRNHDHRLYPEARGDRARIEAALAKAEGRE